LTSYSSFTIEATVVATARPFVIFARYRPCRLSYLEIWQRKQQPGSANRSTGSQPQGADTTSIRLLNQSPFRLQLWRSWAQNEWLMRSDTSIGSLALSTRKEASLLLQTSPIQSGQLPWRFLPPPLPVILISNRAAKNKPQLSICRKRRNGC